MTTRKAATIIGCSQNHVRNLIRIGKLRAKKTEPIPNSFLYTVNASDVRRYAATPQTRGGWPRGKKRKETK